MREQTRLLRGSSLSSPTDHDELGVEDAALVARTRLGERMAYAELYRRHVASIYDFCFHRLGTREAAEDATQAVFLRALRGLDSCDRPEAFRSWLFGIARHIVIDVYRANRRDGGLLDLTVIVEVEDSRPSVEHLAVASEEHDRVRRARTQLNADEQELLDLLQQELTDKEISTILGKRHGAVRTAHYRLRRKLRALLDESETAREGAP